MTTMKTIKEVEGLPVEIPDLDSPGVEKVGEGVYRGETVRFAARSFRNYFIDLKDNLNGNDWPNTRVTVVMVLGGGNNGGDHWGWPGEPFAQVFIGGVDRNGIFVLHLEDHGGPGVVSGVFRWVRNDQHGATARMWRF